jgi:hypothetical protein
MKVYLKQQALSSCMKIYCTNVQAKYNNKEVFNEEVLSFYVRWAFCALQQLIVFLLNVQYIFVTDSCEKPESKNGPL